jgi:midasin (ATPase involved in ribosome maturation)
MAMTGGSVSVDDSGNVTSSGMAAALFTALSTWQLAQVPAATLAQKCTLADGESGTVQTNMLQLMAGQCSALGAAIVSYIQTNAGATISTSLGALQTSNYYGDPTTPPASEVTIPIA